MSLLDFFIVFYHRGILSFTEYFSCLYWDNHIIVVFLFCWCNVFIYLKLSLHSGDEYYFILKNNNLYVLLESIAFLKTNYFLELSNLMYYFINYLRDSYSIFWLYLLPWFLPDAPSPISGGQQNSLYCLLIFRIPVASNMRVTFPYLELGYLFCSK